MDLIKIDNTGVMSINGRRLPGVVQDIKAPSEMIFDSAGVEGSSGDKKVFSGFGDSEITISYLLLEKGNGSRYKALETISKAFKTLRDGEPVVYKIECQFLTALDIKNVLFKKLDPGEQKGADTISISITLQENNPVVAAVQEQQDNSNTNENWGPYHESQKVTEEELEKSIMNNWGVE